MPGFEHPPEWWVSLANLTQWLYWPAWAALFSLWALLNTARLADRANRRDRRKEAAYLRAAAIAVDTACELFEKLDKDATKEEVSSEISSAIAHWNSLSVASNLDLFDIKQFSSEKSIRYLITVRSAAKHLYAGYESFKENNEYNLKFVESFRAYGEEAVKGLNEEAERIDEKTFSQRVDNFKLITSNMFKKFADNIRPKK